MLPDAYLFGLVPAWVLAGVDWAVSAKPRYLRLSGAALAGAAGVMTALVVLHFGEILTGGVAFLMIALIGAIPAAVCSWLSDKPIKA
jgi:hypothetical protein